VGQLLDLDVQALDLILEFVVLSHELLVSLSSFHQFLVQAVGCLRTQYLGRTLSVLLDIFDELL